MRKRRTVAERFAATLTRVCLVPALLVLVGGLAGCRHKVTHSPLPIGVLAPIELETPDNGDQPEIAELSPPDFELPLPPPPAPKPVIRRKPTAKEEQPAQVASAPEPAALAIGALSTSDEATPDGPQQAKDLIGSIQKRIAALPPRIAEGQKKQVRQVKHFVDQAQAALSSGDADGALNLATKAKLLMDDLEKR